jgi:hypothetical protein
MRIAKMYMMYLWLGTTARDESRYSIDDNQSDFADIKNN